MNNAPLNIRDIELPTDILWWPLTWMSWLLVLLVVALTVLGVWLFIRFRKRRVIGYVNQSLEDLFARYKNDFDASAFARGISVLFKRIYLTIDQRAAVAGLSGNDWLIMLDQGLEDKPFTTGVGRVLLNAPYQQDADYDVESLYTLCLRRIETLQLVT